MDKQAKKKFPSVTEPTSNKATTTTKNKTSLGKRKESEPESLEQVDSVVMNEPRNKIQKLTHSDEKMKSDMMFELSFVQPEMACARGAEHTITLYDDGSAHSFGRNIEGQLGLGHNNRVSLPTPIPNLPQITLVSCGGNFTVCVDEEGFIWSFGENDEGQLGTGNKTDFNVPQKLDLTPVLSISCGYKYTLMITNDSNLWSCGINSDNYVMETQKVAQNLKKHHFRTF